MGGDLRHGAKMGCLWGFGEVSSRSCVLVRELAGGSAACSASLPEVRDGKGDARLGNELLGAFLRLRTLPIRSLP